MRKVTKMWTTKDGTKVRICDMTDQHLENTIRMLERAHDQIQDEPFCDFCEESEWLELERERRELLGIWAPAFPKSIGARKEMP